jgi:hypothetical protein
LVAQLLISTVRSLMRLLAGGARKVQAWRERLKAVEDVREARGITLLREWLSTEQRAQFDTTQSFDVIGCDSGNRFRILYGTATNIQELDDAGQPVMGWCFIPSGQLVAGDVMLSQKIALETNERAALAVANQFSVRPSNPPSLLRRAY